MSKFIDMTGWKMWEHGVPDSRLEIVEFAGFKESIRGKRTAMWKCKCLCGKEIIRCGRDIRDGTTKSCGCLRKEITAFRNKKEKSTHGESRKNSRLYTIWENMKSRCYDERNASYKHYGGRGISVCDEWRLSYETFKAWAIQTGYSGNLTLDRISVNGNYEPSNCRWATWKEQENNSSHNDIIEYNGKSMTLHQWSEELGVAYDTLRARLRRGWNIERALTEPVKHKKCLTTTQQFDTI